MAAFWEAFGSILAVPGGSGTRSGFWAFPDSAGAAQKRFLGAPGAFLAGVLGVSWGRLGLSWGVSWVILGRLGASGKRLGIDFLEKRNKVEAFHPKWHCLFNFKSIFH